MMKTVGVKSQTSESESHQSAKQSDTEVSEDSSLKELTLEDAKRLFLSYAQELTAQKRTSLAAFLTDPLITLTDQNAITFTVGSKIVESEITDATAMIVAHFQSNGFVLEKLDCKVNAKQISDYKMFTPQQQFEDFAKKYPKLNDFAERFYLDFD
ncbi:MAG: hypothetical protein L7U61_06035 [Flavobacteriaceae bacterium]|nr:hypothetical protein [Flavobacteriaceae bacterium]